MTQRKAKRRALFSSLTRNGFLCVTLRKHWNLKSQDGARIFRNPSLARSAHNNVVMMTSVAASMASLVVVQEKHINVLLLVGVGALWRQGRKQHCLSPSTWQNYIDNGSSLCFSESGFESSFHKNGDDIPLLHLSSESSLACNIAALPLFSRIQGHVWTYPRCMG